uniref:HALOPEROXIDASE n=1 Tax=Corallina officinalis TaxID=35170 RepID=UPI0000112AA4|nr:Chain A, HALOPEROXIDASE [Corallina officinalis]1QHB_B Chain B, HALOPEROXIDASE [Corallina officinalis]1QHB_C Chain C, HALOPEROXIDASE [Corallina officinalis]1QHB_D Chain D, HALOPEROXIDASE [Corallina officinalis]1QHB_E Chain E, HALOPEROXIDASE [Corallina officinalis]1QHB_F Chain F, HALOPEROXIDASE [Corallina officinalis]
MGIPADNLQSRAKASFDTRVAAAELALARGAVPSFANGEELLYRNSETGDPSFIGSFTKGLPHDDNGAIIDPDDFLAFVRAINSGDEKEIAALTLGPARDPETGLPIWRSDLANSLDLEVRGWENSSAGLTFDLEGPDAQSVAMPPAPVLTSPELIAEMAELYLMALGRDIEFSEFDSPKNAAFIRSAIERLNGLEWFNTPAKLGDPPAEIRRRRGEVTVGNLFRGILPGSEVGPYLSQFIIVGSKQIGSATVGNKTLVSPNAADEFDGEIAYGSITISQRVRIATPGRDFMTDLKVFLDVQDAADFRGFESYEPGARLIRTIRDLATWVHFDSLYEAYLNACLILLANGVPFDPNLPFQQEDKLDNQDVFVNFGSAHVLSLVTEVATRALKAVRYQKFNIHRRLRPEATGGLISVNKNAFLKSESVFPEVDVLVEELSSILDDSASSNEKQNIADGDVSPGKSFLLPMAFAEGSPFHPSYGSGHAVVAGACVTILKAFFDANFQIDQVFEVDTDEDKLVKSSFPGPLTVAGELNKLADNVAIGRNMAGVHYFSDQFESLLLGEQIAIGILEEQSLTYGENFFFNLPKFDGTTIQI